MTSYLCFSSFHFDIAFPVFLLFQDNTTLGKLCDYVKYGGTRYYLIGYIDSICCLVINSYQGAQCIIIYI